MSTVKVHIPGKSVHGIRRVVEAQLKYYPEFGIELVDSVEEADVINTHGADHIDTDITQPILNTNHGLYWSRYEWGSNYQEVNCMVIKAMVQAKAHTVPSEWVATSVRRGGLFYPEVVYHGIDADLWQKVDDPGNYLLWNKARADYVSNPRDMNRLAEMIPQRKIVTTIGKETHNVSIIGTQKFADMKRTIQNAGLYLCTARETFGIGTLEAMACGVPVVGWDWGGQSEIIQQGVTGYLAKPGEYTELAEMIERAFAERQRMAENCMADVRENWTWKPRIKQYADIVKRLHTFYNIQTRPKVTVIVTAYHLDRYLPKCLDSVRQQSFEDFECIVVDDGLLDSTREIVENYARDDRRFSYLRPDKNLGLPAARNFGFLRAKGLFIRHLDADDWLDVDALRREVVALENDNSLWIGYGPMMNVDENDHPILDGDGKPQLWATHNFSWRQQMSHINNIPSCCMVKREVFDRSGGYRTRMAKAEDAHFWCLVTSNGFTAARITDQVTMFHRVHSESKGMKEWERDHYDGDWTAWFPYRFGANTYGDGYKLLQNLGMNVPNQELVPFSVDAPPPPDKTCWDVHDFSYPVVSVIVTVGPGYEKYIQDCLDSLAAQTYPDWECIVVNDTGQKWPPARWDSPLNGYPWAVEVYTGGNHGVSRARNVGFHHAQGKLIVWLDVDDFWLPWFLEKTVAMYEANDGIIYPDVLFGDGVSLTTKPYRDFVCQDIVQQGLYPGTSVLVPRWVHEKIIEHQGGWDEKIPGMEDWDYQFAAHAVAGACAYHVEEPLFIYRWREDGNREKHQKFLKDIVKYMDEKWPEYRYGGKEVGCGCKNKNKKSVPSSRLSSTGASRSSPRQAVASTENQTVDLEYLGPAAKITYRGQATGQTYKFGSLDSYRVKRVFVADAEGFLKLGQQGQPLFRMHQPHQDVPKDISQFVQENLG